jgi:hypothetical protein
MARQCSIFEDLNTVRQQHASFSWDSTAYFYNRVLIGYPEVKVHGHCFSHGTCAEVFSAGEKNPWRVLYGFSPALVGAE